MRPASAGRSVAYDAVGFGPPQVGGGSMGLILLTLIGVPTLVLLGAFASAAGTRRAFATDPAAVTCKIGLAKRSGAGIAVQWSRRRITAVWVHDSLIVVGGLFRTRISRYDVATAPEAIVYADSRTVRGLGAQPVVLGVVLANGQELLLAAAGDAATSVAGPFLTVLLPPGGASTSGRGAR